APFVILGQLCWCSCYGTIGVLPACRGQGEMMVRAWLLGIRVARLRVVELLYSVTVIPATCLQPWHGVGPKDELAAAGWREGDPGSLEKAIPMVAEVWRRRGREFLQPGWSYVAALRRGRVRTATALPLILAEKTIDALDSAGAGALVERVKVNRSQVWTSLARAMVS
ncbi:MAG: hypothetical protein KDM64_19210, partial [Verrucomicrobiae bacterium]|nr:hypothetical protein [Verrucomicrobiae bacterium]